MQSGKRNFSKQFKELLENLGLILWQFSWFFLVLSSERGNWCGILITIPWNFWIDRRLGFSSLSKNFSHLSVFRAFSYVKPNSFQTFWELQCSGGLKQKFLEVVLNKMFRKISWPTLACMTRVFFFHGRNKNCSLLHIWPSTIQKMSFSMNIFFKSLVCLVYYSMQIKYICSMQIKYIFRRKIF